MSYSAHEIAQYVITNCIYRKKYAIVNWRLQNILFFSAIEYYKRYNEWLIEDTFVSSVYGPIVEIVYNHYKCYGCSDIIQEFNTNIDNKAREVIDDIIDRYYQKNASIAISEFISDYPGLDFIRDKEYSTYSIIYRSKIFTEVFKK